MEKPKVCFLLPMISMRMTGFGMREREDFKWPGLQVDAIMDCPR